MPQKIRQLKAALLKVGSLAEPQKEATPIGNIHKTQTSTSLSLDMTEMTPKDTKNEMSKKS